MSIAPRRRATFRQALLGLRRSELQGFEPRRPPPSEDSALPPLALREGLVGAFDPIERRVVEG
jgi:hypothetical protein